MQYDHSLLLPAISAFRSNVGLLRIGHSYRLSTTCAGGHIYIHVAVSTSMIATIAVIHQSFGQALIKRNR